MEIQTSSPSGRRLIIAVAIDQRFPIVPMSFAINSESVVPAFSSSLTSATRLCAGVHFIAIISLFAKSHPPSTADPATHVAPSTFKRANFRVIFLKQSLRPVLFSFQLQTSLTEPMTLSKSVSLPRSAYWHHITRQNSVGEIYSLQGK